MPLPRLSPRGRGSAIAIGAMKDQLTIQTRLNTNSYGKPGGSWSTFNTLPGKVEHLTGREVVNAAEYAAMVTDRITIPYIDGVEPRMRIIFVDQAAKEHRYDILFIQNVEQRSFFLELLVQEIFDKS